ncbi:IS3 family transposase [Haemophilus haemoglobinophilus]|nr:IS3 family transposase [Canicola haemoglobinophilus]MBN6712227.1 IS3 family transposase [Canicola haemoglobinophilus]
MSAAWCLFIVFFRSLKVEKLGSYRFKTRTQVLLYMAEYIEDFTIRDYFILHRVTTPPMQFEMDYLRT